MGMRSLNTGEESIAIPAAGMFQIRAHALGTGEPVRLIVDGPAQLNQVDPATVKVLQVTGEIRLLVVPARGGEFGPGASTQVVISRGRPGTDAAEGVELPPVTLDGRAEAVVGSLGLDGHRLQVRAASGKEANLQGPASTVGAAVRSALDSRRVTPPPELGLRLHLDRSASMSVPAVREHIDAAVSVVVGAASIACPDGDIVLVIDGEQIAVGEAIGLSDAVSAATAAQFRRIGGGESVGSGTDALTFVISDTAPAAIAEGTSNAVALVVGKQPRPDHPLIVTVDATVAGALEQKRHDAIGPVVDAVLTATSRLCKEFQQ